MIPEHNMLKWCTLLPSTIMQNIRNFWRPDSDKMSKMHNFFSKILVKPLFYFNDPNFMQNFRTIYPLPIIPIWLNPPLAFWTWGILLQISEIIVTANPIPLLNVIFKVSSNLVILNALINAVLIFAVVWFWKILWH